MHIVCVDHRRVSLLTQNVRNLIITQYGSTVYIGIAMGGPAL